MSSAYTSLLQYVLPATGEDLNTWGTLVNNSLTQLVEDSVAGVATQDVTSADWTLTIANGATDQARMAILVPTGTPGTTRYIYAPAQSKIYCVINKSNATVQLVGGSVGSATTGISISAGSSATAAWNGSDFVQVAGNGGAVGGGSDKIFILNGQTVTTNYTVPSGQNAGSFGPVSVNSGVVVTLPTGSTWTVV